MPNSAISTQVPPPVTVPAEPFTHPDALMLPTTWSAAPGAVVPMVLQENLRTIVNMPTLPNFFMVGSADIAYRL